MDGHAQRRALTAAERAIERLAVGDGDGARRAAATAADLDQLGLFAGLASLIDRAVADLAREGVVSGPVRAALVEELGPGPVAAAVESLLAP